MHPWLVFLIVHAAVTVGRVLIWVGCHLTFRGALAIARWVTLRLEPLTRRSRHANQKLFFEPNRGADLEAIDRAHLDYLARMRAEITRCFNETPEHLRRCVELEGEEHLREVLALRKGALLVSGHSGTWWFIPAILVAKGYRVTAIFTPIKFPRLERILLKLTSRFGVQIAFVGRDAYKAARHAIEHNEILYLTFDVAVRTRRIQSFPLGRGQLQVDRGPAIIAARHSMPTIQAMAIQRDQGRHVVRFYAPRTEEKAPRDSGAEQLCRLWTARLEEEIRECPEQWWCWGYVDLEHKSGC